MATKKQHLCDFQNSKCKDCMMIAMDADFDDLVRGGERRSQGVMGRGWGWILGVHLSLLFVDVKLAKILAVDGDRIVGDLPLDREAIAHLRDRFLG